MVAKLPSLISVPLNQLNLSYPDLHKTELPPAKQMTIIVCPLVLSIQKKHKASVLGSFEVLTPVTQQLERNQQPTVAIVDFTGEHP